MDGRVSYVALKEFVIQVFVKIGVPIEDARVTADVLVAANLRGIDSHGVARTSRYVQGLRRNARRDQRRCRQDSGSTGVRISTTGKGRRHRAKRRSDQAGFWAQETVHPPLREVASARVVGLWRWKKAQFRARSHGLWLGPSALSDGGRGFRVCPSAHPLQYQAPPPILRYA